MQSVFSTCATVMGQTAILTTAVAIEREMGMRRVLLVDDDDKSLLGVKMILLRADTEFKDISVCKDGLQAIDMLKMHPFDLIITDIKMPNMDGMEFIRSAQAVPNKPRFIIMSGYQNYNVAKEALRYGVREYLLKPVGRHELIESVRKIEEELIQEELLASEKTQNTHLHSMLITK